MSTMIDSGLYNIKQCPVFKPVHRHVRNNEFVGHDVPDTFYVDVVDKVPHLATLKDTKTGLYLTLDPQRKIVGHKVVGKMEPQILQLSSEDGEMFIIHPQDVNEVAYLKDDGNWSWYWKFCPAN
ncbi:hypothetical protein BDR07DRAFT_1446557 [Suillus spraguei]|nr:hypothetical protein BDR07DRAFT_1446557 [Suillus spraguei]